ncbi:MAG: hypothetical protein AAGA96_10095 [Verrucomicrobiota bacterium]
MKIAILSLVVVAVSSVFTGCVTTQDQLPPLSTVNTVAKEGTLADHVLAKDASLAIRKIMGGGSQRVIKFVLQQPVGSPGNMAWREMWVYDPEGTKKAFVMTFREDGQGSADFEIQPM